MTNDQDPTPAQVRVLLVEDNPIDARATMKAAKKLKIQNTIDHVEDGASALEYLRSSDDKRPDLVLLDLNLPGIDGLDVLAEMKSDPELRRIPVVVLTTSSSEADVHRAYDLGVNSYVTKPVGLDGWLEVVQCIDGFWFSLVQLPPR